MAPIRTCLLLAIGATMASCTSPLRRPSGAEESRADFYVATDGRDTWPGTREKPFATLQRARDAVRKLVAAGLTDDVKVLIRGGTYYLPEGIVFGPEDSGSKEHRITYAACPGEVPVLIGGVRITG